MARPLTRLACGNAATSVCFAALLVVLCALPLRAHDAAGTTEQSDELRHTERMLTSILKSAPTGIGVVENRVLVQVNDYILDLTGYSREELIGRSSRMLYPTQEDFDFVGREKYRQISEKGTGSVETRWRRKDGSILHVIQSSTPLDPRNLAAGVTFTVLDITARKEAETQKETALLALRESEQRFRDLFAKHGAVSLLVDPRSGRILDANPAAVTYYGWTREELTAMCIQDINTLSSEEVARERQKAETGQRTYFEFRHRRADGSIRDVAVFSAGITTGSKVVLYSIIHDITARKEAEAALAKRTQMFLLFLSGFAVVLLGLVAKLVVSMRQRDAAVVASRRGERKLRSLFGAMNDVVLVLDREGRYIEVAPTNTDLFYRPPREVLGRTLREVVSPAMAERALRVIRETLDSKRMSHYDYELEIGGRPLWFSAVVTPLTPDSVVWVARDITDRKLVEDALRESERSMSVLLGSLPGMAYRCRYDERWTMEFLSEGCRSLTGHEVDDLLHNRNLSFNDLILPQYRRMLWDLWADRVARRLPVQAEYEIRTADGQTKWVWEQGQAIFAPDGAVEGLEGLILDVTDRRKAEDALRAAKDAAEAASRAKSAFLANMSHEIRTPINGVMGMLQVLRATALDEEQAGLIATAMQSCGRLVRLLSDILDFSRIEAGKLSILVAPMSIAELLCHVRDLFSPIARGCRVELCVDVDPAVPWRVLGDAARLQQVLVNLVGNACKFTPSGRVAVEAVALTPLKRGQCRVFFSVSDTGIGIADEHLADLFQPFSQVDEGYSRAHQGAGLGLSISRRLVELMGGGMSVISEPGMGTTVSFALCFDVDVSLERFEPASARPVPASLGGMRILLAEDDAVSAMAAQAMLGKHGARVTHVADGRSVLTALGQDRCDLILMDVQMPDMDGVEATRRIRSGQAGEDARTVPIIAMTAYAMAGDRERFLEAGMDDYVPKPVDVGELLEVIAAVLGRDLRIDRSGDD